MKILTILARYGVDDYVTAEADIDALFGRQLPAVVRDVIVVDNAIARESVAPSAGRVVLGGDNRVREFTAFDRAIEFAGARLWTYDFIHFATSAFNTLYTKYLDRFTEPLLNAAAGHPVAIGHIDCYNAPIRVRHFLSQHWLRTGFFMLPAPLVRALGSMTSLTDGERWFTGAPAVPFRAEAPISRRYRRYIIDWLTGADIGQQVTWHSRLALTAEGRTAFEQKALCILNEHLLGARLRALGCPLIDVTWLATHLGTTAEHRIPWHTLWRQQLAQRDQDAIMLSVGEAHAGMPRRTSDAVTSDRPGPR